MATEMLLPIGISTGKELPPLMVCSVVRSIWLARVIVGSK